MALITRRNRIIPPQNRYADKVAQQQLQQIAPTIKAALTNALAVNSYQVLYYYRSQQGPACSCSKSTRKDAVGLDEQGNATPEQIASILNPNGNFGINNYQKSGNSNNPLIGNKVTTGPILGMTDNVLIGDGFVEQEFNNEQLLTAPHIDSGSTGCGVCYGQGVLPGYNLYGGERLVFDVSQVLQTKSIQIDRQQFPNVFTYVNGGSVTFSLSIPMAVCGVYVIRLMNGLEPSQGVLTMNVGSSWIPLTTDNILANIGGTYPIKVSPMENFTHIEIIYQYTTTPIRADYPNFEGINNLDVLNGEEPVELQLGPDLPNVGVYDVIVDPTFAKAWRVMSFRTHFTREQDILGWLCTARLLQPYEICAGLYMPPGVVDPKTSGVNQRAGGY